MLMTLLEGSITFLIELLTKDEKNEYFLQQVKSLCAFLQYFAPYHKSRDHLLLGGGNDNQIAKWDRFSSFPEAYRAVETFCAKNFHPIKIVDSHTNDRTSVNFLYRDMSIACVHYGKCIPSGKGIRTKRKTYCSGCPFVIRLRLSRTPMHYRISFLNLKHNHEIGPSIYCQYVKQRALNKEERDFVKEIMVTSDATNKQIALFVQEFMNKSITNKDVSNLYCSFKKTSSGILKNEELQIYTKELFAKKWIVLQGQEKTMLSTNQKNIPAVFPSLYDSNFSPDVLNVRCDSQQIENSDNNLVSQNSSAAKDEDNEEEFRSSPAESLGRWVNGSVKDHQIARWDMFKSFPEASHVIRTFCLKNFHPIRVAGSNVNDPTSVNFFYRYMFYACVHYGRPRKCAGKGIRKRTKLYPSHCPFFIKLSLSRTPMHYRIIFLNLKHNHQIGPTIYVQYNQERALNGKQKDFVREMIMTSNARNKEISLFVQEFMNKSVTNKDICNIRFSLKKSSRDAFKNGEQKYVKEIFAEKWMEFQAKSKALLSSSQDSDKSVFPCVNNSNVNPNLLNVNANVLNVRYDSQPIENTNNLENQTDLTVSNDGNVSEQFSSHTEARKLSYQRDGRSQRFLDAKCQTDKLAAVLTQFSNKEFRRKLKNVSLLARAWGQKENIMFFKEENNVLKLLKENIEPIPQIKPGIKRNLNPKISSKEHLVRSNIDNNVGTLLCETSVESLNKDKNDPSIIPSQSNLTVQALDSSELSVAASHDSFMHTDESSNYSSWKGAEITSVFSLNKKRVNRSVPVQNNLTKKSCKKVKVSAPNQTPGKMKKIPNLLKIVLPKGISVDETYFSESNLNIEKVEELNQIDSSMDEQYDLSMNADELSNNSSYKEVQISSVVSCSKQKESLLFDKNIVSLRCNLTDNSVKEHNRTEVCRDVLQNSCMDIDESACKAKMLSEEDASCKFGEYSGSCKRISNAQNKKFPACVVQNVIETPSSIAKKNNSVTNKNATNTILFPKVRKPDQVLSISENYTDQEEHPSTIGYSMQTSLCEELNNTLVPLCPAKIKESSKQILLVPHPNRYNSILFWENSVNHNKKTEVSISLEKKNSTEAKVMSVQNVPLARPLTPVQTFKKSEKVENEKDAINHNMDMTEPTKNILSIKQEDPSAYWDDEKSLWFQKMNMLLTDVKNNESIFTSNDNITQVKKAALCKKVQDLKNNLTIADIEDIVSHRMLNDKIMNVGQVLIKLKFPEACGFQDVLLGSALKFKVVSSREKFVQIIHCGSFPHWITASTFDAPPGVVFVYDSISEPIPRDAVPQICNIMNIQSSCLTVISKPMQLQTNAVDCGLFALASAITILCGKDPSSTVYNVSTMRQHLLTGLIGNNLQAFPILIGGNFVRSMGMTESFSLHCLCRQPILTDSSFMNLKDLYKCEICKKSYHKHCKAKCCEDTFINSS